MTDSPISELIERLNAAIDFERQRAVKAPAESAPVLLALEQAVAKLSRLTVSSPSEETTGLCDHLTNPDAIMVDALRFEAAAALQRMAQRTERQRVNLVNCAAKMREDSALIAELEAERDSWRQEHGAILDDIDDYISDTAIRAKTIEDVAAAIERTHVSGGLLTPAAAAVRIRALNQPEAGGGD